MTFGKVAILGPGLIGGSLALALNKRGLADQLRIYARKKTAFPEIRRKLPRAQLTTDVVKAVRGADVVVLCVPIGAMAGLVKKFSAALEQTTLVTDVGSVKESVDHALAPLLKGKALWVGGHPMAGSEQAGFAAAKPDLFKGAAVILTPTRHTQREAHRRAEQLWRALEARVISLSPGEHDRRVAQISHLPHLVAAALAAGVAPEALALAGGGFRDTTRVAAGSPKLWSEILSSNRKAVSLHLGSLIDCLSEIKLHLGNPKRKQALLATLKKAHAIRSQLPEKPPS